MIISSMIAPLPKVNGDLMLEVFTHSSLRHTSSDQDSEYGGNERLCEVGIHALQMAVTSALFRKRPMLSADQIAEERRDFFNDDNVRNIVVGKGLRSKLRFAESASSTVDTPEELLFLFNVYMGAVYAQSGEAAVQAWVDRAVYKDSPPASPRPYSHPASPSFSVFSQASSPAPTRSAPSPTPTDFSKSLLPTLAFVNQLASQKGLTITYSCESSGQAHQPIWVARCLINGSEVSQGQGKNQKSAKEEAARVAFHNLGWGNW